MEEKTNDLTEIITHALNEMKNDLGEKFDIDHINLAELQRRTGITRAKLRRIQKDGFADKPHALIGRKKRDHTIPTGFTGVIDTLLSKGITNSSVCFDRMKEAGYRGTLVNHKELYQ